jgi:hypothetical protein
MDDYFLPAHVHCCRRGDAFVFLDLKQDDYTLIAGPPAEALRALSDPSSAAPPSSVEHVLAELVDGGLLTRDGRAGKAISVTRTELALEPLLDIESPRPSARLLDYFNFFAACTTAAARLRWGALANTVEAVARRKVRHGNHPIDIEHARHLTAVFHKLRKIFPANYLCLFDSLALIEFLARYDIYPTWVFGIKLDPWAAHCWIQQGQLTFNEGVEEAASYTPIMAI